MIRIAPYNPRMHGCESSAMRRVTVPAALGLAALMAAAGSALVRAQPPTVTAIKAARLFDGKSGAIVADAVVIVEGRTLRAAGSRLALPAGAPGGRLPAPPPLPPVPHA